MYTLNFTLLIVAKSPENKAKWAEIRKREAAEHHH
jgi:hypothetical protein